MKVLKVIIVCFAIAGWYSPANSQTPLVSFTYQAQPELAYQLEWIQATIPQNLLDDPSKETLFFARGGLPANGTCGDRAALTTVSCLRQFYFMEMEKPFADADYVRLRYYASDDYLNHNHSEVSFFAVVTNVGSRDQILAVSDLHTLDLSKPAAGIIPRPSIYLNQEVPPPVRDTSIPVMGDPTVVWVDDAQGDDSNDGITAPVKTIGRAINVLRSMSPQFLLNGNRKYDASGLTVMIRGGFYHDRLAPIQGQPTPLHRGRNDLEIASFWNDPNNPLKVRGYPGELVVLDRFSEDPNDPNIFGEANPSNFFSISPQSNWGCDFNVNTNTHTGGIFDCVENGVAVGGSRGVIVENLTIIGAGKRGISVSSGQHVTLKFINIFFTGDWGIQTDGFHHNLTIQGLKILGSGSYGDRPEHGIYIAGGGFYWNANEPVRNIIITDNEIEDTSSHGIQINGASQDVLIARNRIVSTGFTALQLTGATGVVVKRNVFANTMRNSINIFDYLDSSYYERYACPQGQQQCPKKSVDLWRRSYHQNIAEIDIFNNTFAVKPESPRCVGSGSSPGSFPVIMFNEGAGTELAYAGGPELEPLMHPYNRIRIYDNIIQGFPPQIFILQMSKSDQDARAERFMEGISVHDNIIRQTRVTSGTYPGPRLCGLNIPLFCQGTNINNNNTGMLDFPLLSEMADILPNNWFDNQLNVDPLFQYDGPPLFQEDCNRQYAYHMIGLNRILDPTFPRSRIPFDAHLRPGSPGIESSANRCPSLDLHGNPPSGTNCNKGAVE